MDATGWLTAALVAVTGYYALQNHRMVGEMREARRLSVQPKLSLYIFMMGPTFGIPRLVNVGQGPALNVDTKIVFRRKGVSGAEERIWKASVMPPGDQHDFLPPEVQQIKSMEHFARVYSEVRVTGTMRSSIGDTIEVDETTDDLWEWYEMSAAASHVWEEEWSRKMPKELEKIRKALEQIQKK